MSTTAPAKPKTPPSISAQLEKLEQGREATHVKAKEARARVDAYAVETEQARADYTIALREQVGEGVNRQPTPGTPLAAMRDAVRKRMAEPNPHQPAYETARNAFHEVAEVVEQFRRARVTDLLAELDPEYQAARDEMLDGWTQLARGSDRYGEAVNRAREIICATPGLNGQHLGHDGRPAEWKRQALDALDAEIVAPCLTEMGEWRVDQ